MQLFFDKSSRRAAALAVAGITLMGLLSLTSATVSAADKAYGTPGKLPFNERYPSGSIQTVEAADDILTEAGKEREVINDQYIDDQRDCFKKFFVASCLEDAKDHNRIAVRQVRDVEVEANAYKRQAKADDRDKALAEQRVKDEQDAIRRAQDQKDKEAASARKVEESAAKQQQVNEKERQTAGQAELRVQQHDAKLNKTLADEAAKAPERIANEKAYQDKVKASAIHRKEVETNKAQKEAERAAKKQPQAAPAGAASPAADPTQPR